MIEVINMANEYLMLNEKGSDLGTIGLNKVVFETIASITVNEDADVVLPDATPFYHPINCKIEKNVLKIAVDIRLRNGKNVNEVTTRLQQKISDTILETTAFDVTAIDLKVVGFVF